MYVGWDPGHLLVLGSDSETHLKSRFGAVLSKGSVVITCGWLASGVLVRGQALATLDVLHRGPANRYSSTSITALATLDALHRGPANRYYTRMWCSTIIRVCGVQCQNNFQKRTAMGRGIRILGYH